ncbi:MAG TPA: DUF2442 domain-containing protein [Actinomycetota bacterium]|nr:DUF2442 domain-containing protein [Actinomycetota bacterium]
MTELIDVTDVRVVGTHRLRVTFADGFAGELDFTNREWGGIFASLAEPEYFDKVHLDPELGTIVWPNGADIAPEMLYELATQQRLSA